MKLSMDPSPIPFTIQDMGPSPKNLVEVFYKRIVHNIKA